MKKNGELTLPILDSALVDSDLIPSYQIQGASNGFGGLSGSISDDTSKTTYGIKVVNGILAAYGSVESTITLPDEIQIDDFPLKEKVTFEQGQYLRDGNGNLHGVEWSDIKNTVSNGANITVDIAKNIGNFAWNHTGEIVVGALIGVAIGAGIILASPELVVGGLIGGVASLFIENNEAKNNEK